MVRKLSLLLAGALMGASAMSLVYGAPGSTATIERDKPAPTPSAAEVRAAQRALQHLGFVVKPDGAMTAATRHAIAQFARDRDIASNGDLTPRIQRELARAAAGEAQ